MSRKEATPLSRRPNASAMYGMRSLFTTNPGVSWHRMAVLPHCLANSLDAAMTSSPVLFVFTISKSAICGTGLKK